MSAGIGSNVEDKKARLKQWLESGEIALHPLTFPQRELWEAMPVPPGDPANHICCLIEVRGGLTIEDCRAAIQMVVDHQDALRLSFLPGKERPLQMIRRSGEANFACRELPPDHCGPDAVEARAREVFSEPFDMLQGPLYRVEMLRCGPDHYVLVFAIHHAVADGWTLGVFVQDLCAAYLQVRRGDKSPLPKVPQSYVEWSAAERAYWTAAEVERRASFWKQKLAGSGKVWKRPATPGPRRLNRWVTYIPGELAAAARDLARRSGTTLFSTLLTAFQVTLHATQNTEDIVVGSPLANRNKAAERETMGYYAGNVPIRAKVRPDRSFAESLKETHQTVLDSLANAMPFVEIAKSAGALPHGGKDPIYDTRFALQNHPIPEVDLPGLSARLRMRSTGTARFHLGCEVTEEDARMEVAWLFENGMFEPEEVRELDGRFQAVLAAACRAPDTTISKLIQP